MFNVTVEMTTICCATCGITFSVPAGLFRIRQDAEESIYCPSGHESYWEKADAEDSARIKDLKKDLVLAVHRAEQAEARAREEASLNDRETAGAAERGEAGQTITRDGRRVKCPTCGKGYRYLAGLRNHLADVHQVHPETIAGMVAEFVRQQDAR